MKFLQATIRIFKKLHLLPPYYPYTAEQFMNRMIVELYGTMREKEQRRT